jgi:hypothetical protein
LLLFIFHPLIFSLFCCVRKNLFSFYVAQSSRVHTILLFSCAFFKQIELLEVHYKKFATTKDKKNNRLNRAKAEGQQWGKG